MIMVARPGVPQNSQMLAMSKNPAVLLLFRV
jgi:hypothetical protein